MQGGAIRTMQPNWAAPHQGAWLARFFGKLVLDILPAALASVIGGFLFSQYHLVHTAQPQLVDVQPAPPEMMAMVRDEHALIINYLKAQMAAEQRRDQAEDAATARATEEARAAADAKLADALFASQTQAMAQQNAPAAAPALPKAASVHRRAPAVVAATPHAPLAIAEADPPANPAISRAQRSARPGLALRQSACRQDDRYQGPCGCRDAARRFDHWRNVRLGRRQHRRRGVRESPIQFRVLNPKPRGRVRCRMKWPVLSKPWAVQNNPILCRFATELPSICAENDAFWQQVFNFRQAESCPVPGPSVSHTCRWRELRRALCFAYQG